MPKFYFFNYLITPI